jgi:hypothetical protein
VLRREGARGNAKPSIATIRRLVARTKPADARRLVSPQRDSHIHDIHIDPGRHLVEPRLAPPAHDPIPALPPALRSDIGISVE